MIRIESNPHGKLWGIFCSKKESPVIEFFPQRWFYLGLLISGTTLLSCLGYLGYDFAKRRRQNKKQ